MSCPLCPHCQAQSAPGGPHCGSLRPPTVDHGDETFEPRRGCLDCNRWWEPVRLREQGVRSYLRKGQGRVRRYDTE
jgi:hypothetical protein